MSQRGASTFKTFQICMFLIKIKFWFKDVLSMLGKWWGMMKHQKAHKEMLKH
jgi:hypothetical protein